MNGNPRMADFLRHSTPHGVSSVKYSRLSGYIIALGRANEGPNYV